VDDDPLNRDMLAQRLQRQGFVVLCAEHGLAALDILEAQPIDLVLLDVLMPHMDGYEVLARMQANPALKDVPVLMVSGLSEIESVVRCIEMGATDYLTKPFNPVLLQARIGASLEKKQLRDQERRTFLALEASQRALAAELAEAADYVRSLLPLPSTQAGVSVDWRFRPSMQLGGDAFGFQWLDPDHLSVYLFDVCGHGVGAALLSVGIIEALRSRRLGAVDMRDPSAVLGALNDAFPMELHNGQYFTMWYGVYQRRTRTLVHASGGHPAAQLVTRVHGGVTCVPVWHPGLIVGGMPDVIYGHATVAVPAGSRLYVFSDGLFEIAGPDGRMLPYERFVELFTEPVPAGKPALDHIIDWVRGFASDRFDDDVSILELTFD
jgi:sigma-B regulation protein RsbU (phosphoserine phosphatase)